MVLNLPAPDTKVPADAIGTLPLSLRWQFASSALAGSVPHTLLVEKMVLLGATVEDGEARGRLLLLARRAVGADLSDIDLEAGHWADWAVHSAERNARIEEAAEVLLGQFIKDRGRLQ